MRLAWRAGSTSLGQAGSKEGSIRTGRNGSEPYGWHCSKWGEANAGPRQEERVEFEPRFVLPARLRSCRPGFESACASRWVGTPHEVLPVDRSASFTWNDPVRRGGSAGGRCSHGRRGRRSPKLPSWIRICSRLSLDRNGRSGLPGMGRAGSVVWPSHGVGVDRRCQLGVDSAGAWGQARVGSILPAWSGLGGVGGSPVRPSGWAGLFSRRVSPQAGR